MSTLQETKYIKQITVLPQSGSLQVQWATAVLKDDKVLSETFERCAYSADNLDAFKDGTIDVNAFLAAFNSASLDAKVAAEQAKAIADAAVSAKESELATAKGKALQLQIDLDAKTTELAAAQAELAQAKADLAAAQAQIPAPVPADPLGPVVDDLQIRLALTEAGLRDAVEAAVAAGNQDLKDWYARAHKFKRKDPLVLGMIATLNVSAEQADQLWALAATK